MGLKGIICILRCIAVVYFTASCIFGTVSAQGCAKKSYGTDMVVCVCNATYCDNLQAPEQLLKAGSFLQYTSSKSGQRLVSTSSAMLKTSPKTGKEWLIGSCIKYQEMLGIGGAMTDSVGINLGTLQQPVRESLLNQYYGPNGIGYTFIRTPMGGSDFSTRFYTYDDGEPDRTLSRFSLAEEDFKFKLPYMQYIKTLVPNVKVIATPWSPPTWMVESRNGTTGFTRLKNDYYQVLAQYFVNFLQAYKKNGIDVWGVSSQNEPGDGYYVYFGINSCGYSPQEEANFIANNLGPTLRKYGFGNVNIMDGEEQRTQMPDWAETILKNTNAYGYVKGTALHWYFDDDAPASRLSTIHNDFPEKFILYTEASYLPDAGQPAVSFGNWNRAEKLAADMIDVFNNWVVGWVDWNMALDTTGGPTYIQNYLDSPIIVNATAQEFYKQPIFYALAHFSKFVPPGSKRILLNPSSNTKVESVAFLRPDNIVAVVLLNRNDSDESLVLKTGTDYYIPVTVAAHSLNTVLFNDK